MCYSNNADSMAGKLIEVTTGYGNYFGVLPSYIKAYNNSLKDSVVFLGSCQGLANDNMWNAFKELGAKTVFGFDGDVYKDYVIYNAIKILHCYERKKHYS